MHMFSPSVVTASVADVGSHIPTSIRFRACIRRPGRGVGENDKTA